MKFPFKIGTKCPNMNNINVYASPEVLDFFQNLSEVKYILVDNEDFPLLKKITLVEDYEKNRISFYGYSDDSTVNLKLINETLINNLTFVYFEFDGSADSGILRAIKDFFLNENSLVPLCKGEDLIINEGKIKLRVKKCLPVWQGIWNDATDITIDFVQPVLKNQMSFDIDMIKFATSLLNKSSEVYKTIFNHYKEWLTENFSYRVSEIPFELARKIVQRGDKSRYSSSHVAFMHSSKSRVEYLGIGS